MEGEGGGVEVGQGREINEGKEVWKVRGTRCIINRRWERERGGAHNMLRGRKGKNE